MGTNALIGREKALELKVTPSESTWHDRRKTCGAAASTPFLSPSANPPNMYTRGRKSPTRPPTHTYIPRTRPSPNTLGGICDAMEGNTNLDIMYT
eukprot:Gb_07908 [translate_table: standard]